MTPVGILFVLLIGAMVGILIYVRALHVKANSIQKQLGQFVLEHEKERHGIKQLDSIEFDEVAGKPAMSFKEQE